MSNFINREILLKELEKAPAYFDSGDIRYGIEIAIEKVKEQPAVNVREVKHGKWDVTEHKEHLNVICSNCNEDFYVYKKGQYRIDRSKFCPKCGAKMTGGE